MPKDAESGPAAEVARTGRQVAAAGIAASALLATLSLDGAAAQRRRAVSGAKAKIGRNGRAVAQNAIQTHGAIGTTQELPLGAYAEYAKGKIRLRALVAAEDGSRVVRAEATGEDPESLGSAVVKELRARGAAEILASLG